MADVEANDEGEGSAVECDVCGHNHITEECPMLGLSTTDFKAQISRARLTVPHYLGIIDYSDGEVGIIATEHISNKTQLGPFEAKKTCNIDKDDVFILKILSADGNTICLDSSSENHCNWMALVQVASTREEQNCMAYQLGINIYFNTTSDVPAGTPLKVWYAWKYAQNLGKPSQPDGKTRSMLGLDVNEWRSEATNQSESSANNEGILEAAAYLSSVLPSTSAGGEVGTVMIKEESPAETQIYRCSKCPQMFYTQSDFAIHLRGHIMPSSVITDTRGPARRGRPWGRAGVTRPMGRRGPGRPRKATGVQEPGEIVTTLMGQPKRRGRPRKVQPVSVATVVPKTERKEEGAGSEDPVQPDETSPDIVSNAATDDGEINRAVEEDTAVTTTYTVKKELTESNMDQDRQPEQTTPSAEQDGTTQTPVEGMEETVSIATASGQTPNTPSPQLAKTPKKRGRPPKGLEKGEMTPHTPTPSSHSSRRVQPRRTLKGKRTSTFRYPGESSSDEDAEEKKKGKNVLKRAIKSGEYSDDDFDVRDDDDKGLEEGEINSEETEGVEITVKTPEGFVVNKAPVILLDEDTGKTRTLDPATLSVISSGVDSSGNHVVILQSNTMDTTTTTTTTTSGAEMSTMDADAISQSQAVQSTDASQDALAALVDAALSSQKMSGGREEGREEEQEEVVVEAGQEAGEDAGSDDPDWKGPLARREESVSPRKRQVRRRKGDDPDLEQMEESVELVYGAGGTKEYACGVCKKRFQQLKYLKMHFPAHTDKFLCHDCGRRFARHESLQKHVCEDWLALVERIESEEDGSINFRCKECGRSFPQMEHARRHASMHRGTWACAKCQKTFPKRQMLLDHRCGQPTEGTESGEDSNQGAGDSSAELDEGGEFACDICKQTFNSAKYLFRHMAMHTELFKCQACGKCYSRKDSLQRHILKCCPELAHDYSVFACDKCKKTFGTRLGLENHVINCGKFQCAVCRIAFFSDEDLGEHKCEGKIIDDATGVQFPCKECGKTFASLPYLARHEASHHAAFECEVCKRVFVRREELTWHAPVCKGVGSIERDGSAMCEACQTEFTDARQFREHYQVHTHPYRCDKCGKRFIKVGTLHTHKCDNVMVGREGEEEGAWQCEMCEKTFKNERYLARHKQLHGQPSFDCEYCHKKFIRKDYLNDHKCVLPDGTSVRVVRKKNRLYIRDDLACPHCKKTFSSRSNLNKHMRVHGERQAECQVCGKKFHYDSYLKLHIATVHDRQFQYQCSHCGKILFSKTGLIAHIKQFHQEQVKLFPCPKCGKTFRQKGNMRTHLYSHTKERSFKCDVS
ncbi:hypothetical protein V1264_009650 [Littorina saxatilis]|uniref:Uncharacterized protein n=1 Tax=Littorina saxatilis TaxID=31220 RepID=A0AAN9G289_9CAEN